MKKVIQLDFYVIKCKRSRQFKFATVFSTSTSNFDVTELPESTIQIASMFPAL